MKNRGAVDLAEQRQFFRIQGRPAVAKELCLVSFVTVVSDGRRIPRQPIHLRCIHHYCIHLYCIHFSTHNKSARVHHAPGHVGNRFTGLETYPNEDATGYSFSTDHRRRTSALRTQPVHQ
jgi:hypothetical protein